MRALSSSENEPLPRSTFGNCGELGESAAESLEPSRGGSSGGARLDLPRRGALSFELVDRTVLSREMLVAATEDGIW